MSDLYKIEKIDGKGFGWIAQKDIKRGTLLLNEKAQIIDNGGDNNWKVDPKWIKSVMTSFNQMSEANQKEYLSLHNNSFQDVSHDSTASRLRMRQQVQKLYKKTHEVEKCISILGIFNTNLWNEPNRVCEIHAARMNHSCRPNARVEKNGTNFFVRTIAKIKAGEEITFAYDIEYLSMQNRETRQYFIREKMNFVCVCDFCKFGQENEEFIAAFHKLKNEFESITNYREQDRLNRCGDPVPDLKKKIKCLQDMYNLGKNNKTSWNFSLEYLYGILLEGLATALFGRNLALRKGNETTAKEFIKDGENFPTQQKALMKCWKLQLKSAQGGKKSRMPLNNL